MKKIALLGAGHIGQTIARLLHDSGDYRVTVFDRNAQSYEAVRDYAHAFVELTGNDTGSLQRAVTGFDAVVNALPYTMATSAATAAVAAGCHYFDLTEDVAATHAIAQLAEGASTALMPQCGLAPGFIAIAAHHLAAAFDRVDSVKMRVGALPAFPTNSLKYNLTWSVDGLINEYCQPCEAIRDGARLSVQPLEDLEHFSLDGVEYEAFNTSGGLGTLCETLAGRVRDLDYKSVRYPGHGALMKVLLNELRLKDDQETIKTILKRAIPSTLQDVVLIFVVVNGLRRGVLTQEVFARKIFAERNNGHSASAIQITTASAICAAVDMFFAKQLPQRGFVRQEQIALPDFLANRFGQVYAHSTHIESLS
ncbi:saccharopine dehydrogenase family protein [Pandoraea sputorum]|uniref:saccharopine dehydrogenase family protein n=1 Tax=Pandoraea sputorum TaxID=93222 RepID=UPI002AF6B89D|nr:saccharopine dehydrogenase C-terminal domain-containing protein [Pandoraea sputorum]